MKCNANDPNISKLLDENLKLQLQLLKFKVGEFKGTCMYCNAPLEPSGSRNEWHELIHENARLKSELDKIVELAKTCPREQILQDAQIPPRLLESLGMRTEIEGHELFELVTSSMQEVMKLALQGEPLWISHPQECSEMLNEDEYVLNFPSNITSKPMWYSSEGTRARATVQISPISLAGLFMNVGLWASTFSCMVSSAVIVEKLSSGAKDELDGALLVISAEYQTPEPEIPHRKSVFLRYCKKRSDASWSVTDVSLDNAQQTPVMKCRRRPSGCLIQETSKGFSDVIWVEHFEADNRSVPEEYKTFVNSGLAFGAEQWVYILERQCKLAWAKLGLNNPMRAAPVTGKKRKR